MERLHGRILQKNKQLRNLGALKTYYQIIPEKILLDLEVIDELLRPGIKGYSTDNLKEVISIIAWNIQISTKKAPLKMEYIKKLVPQGDKYLMGMLNLGIVVRSGFAIKGATCFKYGFASEYKSKYIRLPLQNARLQRRIERIQEGFRKETVKTVRGLSDQIKYIKGLTIADEFEGHIIANYAMNTDQYNSIIASATRIINGDFKYSRDSTSGRFHTNVTNMDKHLREYLRCNGEPLVNIDIKNSQPYLSTIILTNPGKVSWMTKNPAFALLLQTLKVSTYQDVKDFINYAISGQLYEYLMREFAKEGLLLSRNETKKQVLRIFFARNRMPKDEINRRARLIFIDRFPTVHRIFSKVRGSERGDKFTNYKRFAILLQSIESYLMLDVILKRIYKELPGTIAITIHDSIMTGVLTNNVDAVAKIMIEELTFFVGHRPNINIERRIEEKREEEREKRLEERIDYNNNQYPATIPAMINNSMI